MQNSAHGYGILLKSFVMVGVQNETSPSTKEAYLLFPVHREGTLLDHLTRMQSDKKFFPAITVLYIFQQVSIVYFTK